MKYFWFVFSLILTLIGSAYAATGTIDPSSDGSYKALIESLGANGTINIGKFTTQSARNISVTDTALRGYAWGEGVGWIVMNCADTTSGCSTTNGNFKVANDGAGNLSGYAWGENTGWINFGPFTNPAISTVKISSGQFGGTLGSAGYAWVQNYGWMKFDCSSPASCVKTDWVPAGGTCSDGVQNQDETGVDTGGVCGGSGGGGGGIPQCRDSRDNEGDTLIDAQDPGCHTDGDATNPLSYDANDADEFNVVVDFCTAHPSDPSCSFCALHPTDAACQSNFCVENPSDPSCQQPFCATHPSDPSCQRPFCELHPTDPSCIAEPFCTAHPSDPSCSFCALHPTDSSCVHTPPTYCQLHPSECVPPQGPTRLQMILGGARHLIEGTAGTVARIAGIAAVGIGSAISFLLINPFSLYDIFLLLLRLWSLLLVALGVKKKAQPWGTVYDSVTKQPIDPAYVVLMDMQGKEIATSITDIEGRYGFSVPAGTYQIVANKTNYEFPSKKLAGKTEDELYRDLYFGGAITVTQEGGIIAKNIPLDQLGFDWNEYAKDEQRRLRMFKRRDLVIARISNALFVIGFVVTGVTMIIAPTVFTGVLLGIYVLMAIVRSIGLQVRPKGSVADTATQQPLPFSVVRIMSNATGTEIGHKVADAQGNYYALVANGTYRVVVDRKNADASYTPVPIPDIVAVKKGYLKQHFKV